jgi:hypothetical protein
MRVRQRAYRRSFPGTLKLEPWHRPIARTTLLKAAQQAWLTSTPPRIGSRTTPASEHRNAPPDVQDGARALAVFRVAGRACAPCEAWHRALQAVSTVWSVRQRGTLVLASLVARDGTSQLRPMAVAAREPRVPEQRLGHPDFLRCVIAARPSIPAALCRTVNPLVAGSIPTRAMSPRDSLHPQPGVAGGKPLPPYALAKTSRRRYEREATSREDRIGTARVPDETGSLRSPGKRAQGRAAPGCLAAPAEAMAAGRGQRRRQQRDRHPGRRYAPVEVAKTAS